MEQLLAIVIFGVLLAITIYGLRQSQAEAERRARGDHSNANLMAQMPSREEERSSPSR